jgi:TRAP-type C4-dicarboxylate transport system permease large subunit
VLVMSAAALGWCISISRVPQTLTPIILAVFDGPLMFLLFVNVLLLVIGCFMEALAAMLILIPILAPAAASYGIDPVQFGVMVVLNLIIGTVTPPVGVVLFVVTRIAEIRFEVMARTMLPWLVPLLVVLAAITVWPPLTLGLAGAMRGT